MSSVNPDLAGLRALSHPVRLKILGLLRHEGPATATTLSRHLDLNTGATSYHLRQLAQHGFIEEDTERGNARDRWWKASHDSTRTDFRASGIVDEDAEAYLASVAMMNAERTRAAVSEMPFLPEAWKRTGTLSDWTLTLTPGQADELVAALARIIEDTPDSEDPDAAQFVVNLNAYLRPGQLDS